MIDFLFNFLTKIGLFMTIIKWLAKKSGIYLDLEQVNEYKLLIDPLTNIIYCPVCSSGGKRVAMMAVFPKKFYPWEDKLPFGSPAHFSSHGFRCKYCHKEDEGVEVSEDFFNQTYKPTKHANNP